jgi:hypothetical protein
VYTGPALACWAIGRPGPDAPQERKHLYVPSFEVHARSLVPGPYVIMAVPAEIPRDDLGGQVQRSMGAPAILTNEDQG